MQIATTTVSPAGQGELKANAARVHSMRAAIDEAAHRGADLVVFPAGVLRAPNERSVVQVARGVLDAAKAKRVAVQLGVDCEGFERVKKGPLPSFLLVWTPPGSLHKWRQRSRTPQDAASAPPEAVREQRVYAAGGLRIAPIVCGEVYSQPIRTVLAAMNPALAVLSAHFAAGSRHWAPQESLQRLGVPSVRSAHASTATRDLLVARDGLVWPEALWVVGDVSMRMFTVTSPESEATARGPRSAPSSRRAPRRRSAA
jgi:predicted amidohydrolase